MRFCCSARTDSDCTPYLSRVLEDEEEADEAAPEEEADEAEEPEAFWLMAESVLLPAMPSALRPLALWKAATADSVLLPKCPVMLPE